ncbi:MAG: hypothetical protein M3069_15900 [Chloroflexota bacterium]|nr:hypothetical protein [Chloroflexota bacterium]
MSFEAQCPQCMFVSRQLTQPTPCLLHVSLDSQTEQLAASTVALTVSGEYDEPYEFGHFRLTVDRPGPFSLREYVRLGLLRSRMQAEPSLLDAPSPPARARSLSGK